MSSLETQSSYSATMQSSAYARIVRRGDDDRPAGAKKPVRVPPCKASVPQGSSRGSVAAYPNSSSASSSRCLEQRVGRLGEYHEPLPPGTDVHREAALSWLLPRRCASAPVQCLGDQPRLPPSHFRHLSLLSHTHGAQYFTSYLVEKLQKSV
jgi:hypothetical protein